MWLYFWSVEIEWTDRKTTLLEKDWRWLIWVVEMVGVRGVDGWMDFKNTHCLSVQVTEGWSFDKVVFWV